MAYELWSQDVFSKGELSPFMYARATVNEYGNGLKTAQNVLTFPTGAAGKRFGTLYNVTTTGFTTAKDVYFDSFQYLNECVYQLIFAPNNIFIYLENGLVATVTGTGFSGNTCYNLSTTTLSNAFRCTGQALVPKDLTRASDGNNVVTAFTSSTLTLTSATPYSGLIIPIQFTVGGGTIVQSSPAINIGVTYFAKFSSSTVFSLYTNSFNARYNIDPFVFTSLGTGTTTSQTLNTWSFVSSVFKNLPVYDFNGITTPYDSIVFTPTGVSGNGVVINLSAPYAPLTSAYVGGAFIGGGGSSRIIAVNSTSQFVVATQTSFNAAMVGIQGSLALLAEPAWSTARGWPQKCSSYQNRALFANTSSLPNGFWASVINDYTDFGDLTTDDDDAISWFPTSNDINFIRFIVPYRSITVHTNSGIYSSPLSDVSAITPTNFTLQLQDSTPADVLQPTAIDNQILVLSGNDAHQMLWDGINNAYTSDIVSIINEQTIRNPVDETAFADLRRAGSRYVFITNDNGSLAVFQTLISQNVGGITPQIMEQSYGNAYFRQTCSSSDGRAWFLVERQIATAASPVGLNAIISPTVLQALGVNFAIGVPTAALFATTGVLATSTPQVTTTQYYWCVGLTVDNFIVYESQEDAIAGVNPITWSSIGILTTVTPWPLSTIFTIEELTQKTFLDCAVYYNSTPVSTITTGALFNAQDVKMVGDGFGFEGEGFNNQVTFAAHGSPVNVSQAYIGFPINTIMEPMPLTLANGPSAKNTTLTKPKHIRTVRFMFNNTIGGTINGIPIALQPFNQVPIGSPPFPARGIFEMSVMKGWDDFNNPTYTIEHNDPFNIQLLGVFYSVDI